MLIDKIKNKIAQARKFSKYKKKDIRIHPQSRIGKFTTIGYGTKMTGFALIASTEEAPVTIGKYCTVAHNLRIRTRNHYTGYANMQHTLQRRHGFPSTTITKGPITIGNAVWIADNVIILSGVEIGDGAVLGAGSIVTTNIPPYAIAVGNPAKVIKKRFKEQIIKQLLDIRWWDWSEDKIARNKNFFSTDFNNIQLEDSFDIYQIIVQ